MQSHQERVVVEKKELDDKLLELCSFICSEVFSTLDKEEKDRLLFQRDIMFRYNDVLRERVEAFLLPVFWPTE